MSIDYQIRKDGDEWYATFSRKNMYCECPIEMNDSEEIIHDKIEQTLVDMILASTPAGNVQDDVYVNGNIVRTDYSICLPEGQELLTELNEAFPSLMDWERNPHNFIGAFDSYRPPYENASISWYDFGIVPSEEILEEYGASNLYTNLIGWYGLKFDMVTKTILLKVVVRDIDTPKPALPSGPKFYAVSHGVDGYVSDWVDCFVHATEEKMNEWCADNSLDYPLPVMPEDDESTIWCFGVLFNKHTLEYGKIKAYARYNISS